MSESTNPHPSTSFSASFLNHPVVPGDEERLSDVFLAAADVRAALARFNTTLESISAQPRNRILERITENFHEVLVSLTSTVTASKKVLQSMLNHDEELKQLLHHQQQQSRESFVMNMVEPTLIIYSNLRRTPEGCCLAGCGNGTRQIANPADQIRRAEDRPGLVGITFAASQPPGG